MPRGRVNITHRMLTCQGRRIRLPMAFLIREQPLNLLCVRLVPHPGVNRCISSRSFYFGSDNILCLRTFGKNALRAARRVLYRHSAAVVMTSR